MVHPLSESIHQVNIPVGFFVIAEFNQATTFKKPQHRVGDAFVVQVIFFALNHQPGMQVAVGTQIGGYTKFYSLLKKVIANA